MECFPLAQFDEQVHLSFQTYTGSFLPSYVHVRAVATVQTSVLVVQWNLSKTATCGPGLTDLYREVAALQR